MHPATRRGQRVAQGDRLGGGVVFVNQNKRLPGSYIRFKSTTNGTARTVPGGGGTGGGSGEDSGDAMTYILLMPDGSAVPAVVVDEEVVFTATENDIRAGTVAATAAGVTVGTKEIPAYHTTEGVVAIPAGRELAFSINAYNFTKLQALVCAFNSSMSKSVATEKVSINGKVYAAGSTAALAVVSVDAENKRINLGITNESGKPCVIRYFTYKEEIGRAHV